MFGTDSNVELMLDSEVKLWSLSSFFSHKQDRDVIEARGRWRQDLNLNGWLDLKLGVLVFRFLCWAVDTVEPGQIQGGNNGATGVTEGKVSGPFTLSEKKKQGRRKKREENSSQIWNPDNSKETPLI